MQAAALADEQERQAAGREELKRHARTLLQIDDALELERREVALLTARLSPSQRDEIDVKLREVQKLHRAELARRFLKTRQH